MNLKLKDIKKKAKKINNLFYFSIIKTNNTPLNTNNNKNENSMIIVEYESDNFLNNS